MDKNHKTCFRLRNSLPFRFTEFSGNEPKFSEWIGKHKKTLLVSVSLKSLFDPQSVRFPLDLQEGLHQLQGGDLHPAPGQPRTDYSPLYYPSPEKPLLFVLLQHSLKVNVQFCIPLGWGVGIGICSQRHAGDRCSIPINTCLQHLHNGKTRICPNSTWDPEKRQYVVLKHYILLWHCASCVLKTHYSTKEPYK